MGNGWTRYRADDVFDTEIMHCVYSDDPGDWLSQANHVFSSLEITSNLEDYVRIGHINFTLTVGNARGDPPTGYLFLCAKGDLQTGPSSFSWPNYPAHWSLDPEGIEALSTEETARLGFPPFQVGTEVVGKSWDASVYAGLHQFHQGKGFDPDSQDVARYLGHPLYELCGDVSSPFAHVDDFDDTEDADDEWADAQSSQNEDSDCDVGSDAEDGVGKDSICVESHEQQAPQGDQWSMDGYTGTKHREDLEPQAANNPSTGGGFIHRIFRALRHSLVVEVDSANIDSDPISPFLV
ncbi:hypothetical protein B0H16DRAFT_644080 [Mycena metata]|uniref:Uncharacterized protein n=1 Tax=Mycena metata TaxID=1033252 RepID=A0AAD7H2C1_9AGAR|nr:hypothetical protein B0H16DRAFT_644080 [Mycena metata]